MRPLGSCPWLVLGPGCSDGLDDDVGHLLVGRRRDAQFVEGLVLWVVVQVYAVVLQPLEVIRPVQHFHRQALPILRDWELARWYAIAWLSSSPARLLIGQLAQLA